MRRTRIVNGLVLTLAVVSCAQRRPAEAPTARSAPDGKPHAESAAPRDVVPRKILRSLDMELLVPSGDSFIRSTEQLGASLGGYFADSQIRGSDRSSGAITLRVPAEKLDTAAAALRQAGHVTSETLHADDISDDYYDLTARLSNARTLETRLLSLLQERTAKLSDVVEVETKLAEVREQIERLEDKRRLWDGQVALSTIKIEFRVSVALSEPAFGGQLYGTLVSSAEAFVTFARGVAFVVVASLPWAPFFAAIVLAIRWAGRRGRKGSAR